MVHFSRQLANLFGEAGHVGQRVEIPFLKLADPQVYAALGFGERH
jgi:hypothetical protein